MNPVTNKTDSNDTPARLADECYRSQTALTKNDFWQGHSCKLFEANHTAGQNKTKPISESNIQHCGQAFAATAPVVRFASDVQTQPATPALPKNYILDQRLFSLTSTFDVKSGSQNYGKISAKLLSLTPTFIYTDTNDSLIAKGRARFIAIGSTVDITDAQGKLVATVKENIWKSFFKVSTSYNVLDPQGNVIATSDKLELFTTDFVIRDNSGKLVVKIHRPMFNLTGDTWEVETGDSTAVDPRVVAMIPAFKTYVDNMRRNDDRHDDDKRQTDE